MANLPGFPFSTGYHGAGAARARSIGKWVFASLRCEAVSVYLKRNAGSDTEGGHYWACCAGEAVFAFLRQATISALIPLTG